ncbi:MAG: TonB-dependent receptor [Acidobacteria bacterium]|nr:MAG: TonB-dependent receptor [Acidobacteriota bacterium]
MNRLKLPRVIAIASILLLATTGAVWAQATSGNLYGTVVDNEGNPLPGVTVTVSGQGAPQVQITDSKGAFRFLGLSPGTYEVKAELDGFSTIDYPNVRINVGRNTTIEIQMSAAIEETITVTSESPLLDERKVSTGATVTQVELEKIPTARDPWVILQSVPGVLVDRINVGGNQSGQQSNFVGGGSGRASAVWNVDGVEITDPAARGASPTYYNFDAFEEMQVSTGGTDIGARTNGVQLNLVTKRGTNEWRGSGRFFDTGSGQADPSVSRGDLAKPGPWNNFTTQTDLEKGNITDSVEEYGADVGGPIIKDHLWIWGSYSFQDIKVLAFGGTPDATELENWALKLNAQLTGSNSLTAFYHYGDKRKFGRGAARTRPPETTWNQTGPTDIYKLEDTHIFNSNFYLTGLLSYVGGGFALAPVSGLNAPDMVLDPGGVWRNSFLHHETTRPQDQAKIDGSYFFNTGNANHELKFGVGFRDNEVTSNTTYPGHGLIGLAGFTGFGPNNGALTYAVHGGRTNDTFTQTNVVLQDTITTGNFTINAGLRYDLQEPEAGSFTIPAQQLFPNEMPAITRPGGPIPFEWESLTPRVGVTYALGAERKTLLRASYSQFADQLGTGFFSDLGVSTFRQGYLYWYDNGDNVIDLSELSPLQFIGGEPGTANSNRVDPGLDPAMTDEIILGVEHAFLPELVVGLSITLRNNSDFVSSEILVVDPDTGQLRPHRRSDYVQRGSIVGTLPNGQQFNIPTFGLAVDRDPARGFFRTNEGLEEDYLGISLTFNKRLSNRWMLRGHFTALDWTNENINAETLEDPNRFVNSIPGSQVLVQSAGSGSFSETWISSTWSFNIAGMYQVAPDRPWGFNVAADINGREGYAIPYRVALSGRSAVFGRDGINRTILVAPENDTFRHDDPILVNFRIEKEFTFNSFGLTVGADVFNAFNDNSTLQRDGVLSADLFDANGNPLTENIDNSGADFVTETVSPRVWRFGVRLSWN